jgi:hypothetical protein
VLPRLVFFTFVLLAIALGSTGSRRKLSSGWGPSGNLSLYTFGAPKISNIPLDLGGHCIPGTRFINEIFSTDGGENTKDLVTWVGISSKHPKMDAVRLGQDGKTIPEKCGWERTEDVDVSVKLHNSSLYSQRISAISSELASVAHVALDNSYVVDVAANVKKVGWGLVGTALRDVDRVSHLMQDPSTLGCMLTFEGTHRAEDWLFNFDIIRGEFCGGWSVHSGFRDILRNMTSTDGWQQNIKPHLSKCRELKVVGHSLGAAMATLFSVCQESQRHGDPDFELFGFPWERATKLSYTN